MASNDTLDYTDGEIPHFGFPPRKRPSTEDDSLETKRSRSDADDNPLNGCLLTSGTGHSSLQKTDSFGFTSDSDSSQKTIECSLEAEIGDSNNSHTDSLLYAIYRAETLQSGAVGKSSALSKSGSDATQNGEVHSSAAINQHVFDEPRQPVSSGTPTGQMSTGSVSATTPKAQPRSSQPRIPCAVLQRIPSVQRDMETISGILGIGQDSKITEEVYSKLCALRTHPQRVEVVTNVVLEEQTAAANHEADHETRALMGDVESVLSRLRHDQPSRTVDPNRVFLLLEANKEHPGRVGKVIETLLQERQEDVSPTAAAPSERTLMDDVQALTQKFPASDPNELYSLLEAVDPQEDRLKRVTEQLEQRTNQTPGTTTTTTTEQGTTNTTQDKPNDEDVHGAFLRDLDIVCKVFPDRDKNEIYALLESCPRQNTRVQEVIRRLMGVTSQTSQEESVPMETDGPDWDSTEPTEPFQDVYNHDPLTQLKRDIAILQAIVPDCDPNYLFEELESRYGNQERVQDISARLLETRNYPRLKDRLEKEKQEARRKQLFDAEIDIEEFLQTFPDPRETFYDIAPTVSESYKQHVKVHLCNIFPMVHTKFINKRLEENNFHLTPTLRRLERVMLRFERGERRGCFRDSPRDPDPLPDTPDEYFYQEILFARNEQRIAVHVEVVQREREARVAAAREAGALLTCTCCYEDELVEDDMLSCSEGHIFCRECIRRMSMEKIAQGLVVVECLDGECAVEFDLNVLQKALPAKTFSVFLKKKQEEEVKAAGIPDLETCPFCSFATIMPNHEDKVFSCLNPECFRQSCRLCKEPNHVPLRCEEVEKQNETRFRTALELRMTEAMLRTCPRCKKRFFKIEGCNKMTCTCGQSMCYICREPINDYDHFNMGKCNLNDMGALHQDEMMAAGRDTLGELKRENPDMDITIDPATILGNLPTGARGLAEWHDADEYDGEDDYDDEEEY